MPLDGHAFLLSQGWSGSGSGLRKGAISRPVTVTQKKNLAGIGKDRDEAFPFWDHLYTVAASAIQIECFSSDDDDDDPRSDTKNTCSSTLELRQTSTGILSNRPPIVGTCASSGASTPTPDSNATPAFSSTPRLSLLALAKRETARRGLYSRFFRGPILGPDDAQSEMVRTEPTPATPQIPFHHDDAKKSGKQKRKIDTDDDEGILKEECERAKRRREKRLRKEAERRKRQDAKNKAKDRKDEDIANSKLVDERVSSPSLDQGSGDETQCVRTEKKKKRLKPTPVDDKLNRHSPISTDKWTLEGEDRAKRSRKRRRRDQGL
ncbi:hypothetical protein F5888DRAFT_1632849 [Russula emetica]|nr:hypothetical protein F5888DRAFT_1632849 [Russula emetica]